MSLRLRPWTVKRAHAIAFVADVHRKLKRVQGAMWCVSVRDGSEIVGVALVGWPSQTQTSDEVDHLRVLRVAVKRHPGVAYFMPHWATCPNAREHRKS